MESHRRQHETKLTADHIRILTLTVQAASQEPSIIQSMLKRMTQSLQSLKKNIHGNSPQEKKIAAGEILILTECLKNSQIRKALSKHQFPEMIINLLISELNNNTPHLRNIFNTDDDTYDLAFSMMRLDEYENSIMDQQQGMEQTAKKTSVMKTGYDTNNKANEDSDIELDVIHTQYPNIKALYNMGEFDACLAHIELIPPLSPESLSAFEEEEREVIRRTYAILFSYEAVALWEKNKVTPINDENKARAINSMQQAIEIYNSLSTNSHRKDEMVNFYYYLCHFQQDFYNQLEPSCYQKALAAFRDKSESQEEYTGFQNELLAPLANNINQLINDGNQLSNQNNYLAAFERYGDACQLLFKNKFPLLIDLVNTKIDDLAHYTLDCCLLHLDKHKENIQRGQMSINELRIAFHAAKECLETLDGLAKMGAQLNEENHAALQTLRAYTFLMLKQQIEATTGSKDVAHADFEKLSNDFNSLCMFKNLNKGIPDRMFKTVKLNVAQAYCAIGREKRLQNKINEAIPILKSSLSIFESAQSILDLKTMHNLSKEIKKELNIALDIQNKQQHDGSIIKNKNL